MDALPELFDWRLYDPRAWGAQCDLCSLRGSTFVPPTLRQGADLLVIAEAPGEREVKIGEALVGASGEEFNTAIAQAGLSRGRCSLSNAVLCRPHGGSMKAEIAITRKRNKAREKAGKEPLLLPTEACRRRLLAEVEEAPALLLMGAYAREALAEKGKGKGESGEEGLMASRGFPTTVRGKPTICTIHPAFVLRTRRWTAVFRNDVAKAVRMVRRELDWRPPVVVFRPTPAELEAFLAELDQSPHVPSYDFETDGLEPTEANIRCLGIGTQYKVLVIPFLSVEDPRRRFYSAADQQRIDAALRRYFETPGVTGGQNEQYDHTLAERRWEGLVFRRHVIDNAIVHHIIWSELPHGLDFQMAQLTDAPQHKGVDHTAWKRDEDLWYYNALDVGGQAECSAKMLVDRRLIEQARVLQADQRLSRFCRELHKVGMQIDIATRDVNFTRQTREMDRCRDKARELAAASLPGDATRAAHALAGELNPGSDPQVREFLFDVHGIEPVPEKAGGYTDGGDPSVSRDNLFYLIDQGVERSVEDLLLTIIDYREAQKLRGTFCTVEPCSDGRVRPTWGPHVVVTGRLSCSDPNLMNIPVEMRDMYVARYGHLLVAFDKANLEARVMSWLAQDQDAISAFLAGADMHKRTAQRLFKCLSVDDVTDKQRQFGKVFRFAAQYLAGVRKIHQMIRTFRDDEGVRPYRDYTYEKALFNHREFWGMHAAIMAYHERNRELWKERGFLASAIHGRRRYFLDGEAVDDVKEELANFPIQSTAADDVNDAIERLLEEYPWGFGGAYTGPVHYNYDSITLEVPAADAVKIAARGVELLGSKLGDMPLPVDVKIGPSWGRMTEYVKGPDGFVPKPKKKKKAPEAPPAAPPA